MKNRLHIIRYDELDSTNSEAARHLSDIDNMSVLSAKRQYAGRGKDSHVWLTEAGEKLTFTIVLKFGDEAAGECPMFPAKCQMLLSAMTAASVVAFLKSKGVEAWVKWPNDVYVDKSKICGLLIELRTVDKWLNASIIGIGLNINQKNFPASLPNPVSLSLLTGKDYDVEKCLDEFLEIFYAKLESVYAGLPEFTDIVDRALAFEDGTSSNENLRASFMQFVDIFK